jgi:signal peptidase II
MARRRRICLALTLALVVLVIDQATKAAVLHSTELRQGGTLTLVPRLLNLVFTWNLGITFGLFIFRSAGVVLIPATLAVMGGLTAWLFRTGRAPVSLAAGAILGGAFGNLIDRICHGQVVDFLHLHWGASDPFPYVFNMGDAAVVFGVALLILDQARRGTSDAGVRPGTRPRPRGAGGKGQSAREDRRSRFHNR